MRILRRQRAVPLEHAGIGASVNSSLVAQRELNPPLVAIVEHVGDPRSYGEVELGERFVRRPAFIAPIVVDDLISWCEEQTRTPSRHAPNTPPT